MEFLDQATKYFCRFKKSEQCINYLEQKTLNNTYTLPKPIIGCFFFLILNSYL